VSLWSLRKGIEFAISTVFLIALEYLYWLLMSGYRTNEVANLVLEVRWLLKDIRSSAFRLRFAEKAPSDCCVRFIEGDLLGDLSLAMEPSGAFSLKNSLWVMLD
jgi:hypothetical protein